MQIHPVGSLHGKAGSGGDKYTSFSLYIDKSRALLHSRLLGGLCLPTGGAPAESVAQYLVEARTQASPALFVLLPTVPNGPMAVCVCACGCVGSTLPVGVAMWLFKEILNRISSSRNKAGRIGGLLQSPRT